MVECLIPFTGHCDLDLLPRFKKNRVRSISLILLKVGNPNLVVGMQLWMAECHIPFLVTLTLTSDLVCRIIVSRTNLILFGNPKFLELDIYLGTDVSHTIFRSL